MAKTEIALNIAPFTVRVSTDIGDLIDGINYLYQDYQRISQDQFCDFYVRVYQVGGVRRFFRKQVQFAFDEFIPFRPLPYAQALPFFEWGLNWCISGYANQYLIIHAAVVEKYGKALILPGIPGAGKSTLCAALIQKGWRLLSDELTLIDCASGYIVPVPRPVSLKNESIKLVAESFPGTHFSSTVHDTLKGSVSLLKPPASSVNRATELASPALVIFPKFQPQAELNITSISKGDAFMKLADLSFNYSVLGAEGFEVLAQFSDQCQTYEFTYGGDFNEASDCFDSLLTGISDDCK
jgi:HprK-related kinase A